MFAQYNKEEEDMVIKSYFYFAKYFTENFEYYDNTDIGDIYKHKDGAVLYSEEDVYDEWYNNGKI